MKNIQRKKRKKRKQIVFFVELLLRVHSNWWNTSEEAYKYKSLVRFSFEWSTASYESITIQKQYIFLRICGKWVKTKQEKTCCAGETDLYRLSHPSQIKTVIINLSLEIKTQKEETKSPYVPFYKHLLPLEYPWIVCLAAFNIFYLKLCLWVDSISPLPSATWLYSTLSLINRISPSNCI